MGGYMCVCILIYKTYNALKPGSFVLGKIVIASNNFCLLYRLMQVPVTGFCHIYIVLVYLVLDMSKHPAIMPGNVRKSSRLTERVALREAESSV